MRIISCSLGCSASTTTGDQISCGITDVFVNQEIRITFTQPLDIDSVSNNSFQMVELGAGRTPPGAFGVDPVDARVLVYRPQLTFDSTGNPIFGLSAGESYELRIPGTALDSLGPFIRSTAGSLNTTRLLCTLKASRGVFDPTPGNPRHTMTVTVVDNVPVPRTFSEVDARGAVSVYRDSAIQIEFDDVMNPATLVNPVTRRSTTISISVDPDGNTADASDQVPVGGEFSITLDQNALLTTVRFVPSDGFPSSGAVSMTRRKIVVNLSSNIVDLGGNRLVQPGNTVFEIESIPFQNVDVVESFDTNALQDSIRSGSAWGNGSLFKGPGGGSGRLGDFVVPAGAIIVLNTDSEDFSASVFDDAAVFNKQNVLDLGDPMTFSVDGGVFDFARVLVASGSVLRFEGSNPVRLLARGECVIQGEIDVKGGSALVQNPNAYLGGVAGPPGPGGGQGGAGGARPDGQNFTALSASNDNPNDPGPVDADVLDSSKYVNVNGKPGAGILFPSTLEMTPTEVAFGNGGLAWPQPDVLPFPNDTIHFPADVNDALTSFVYEPSFNCAINTLGGVGAGGAHALSGFTGITTLVPPLFNPPLLPTPALGGDSAELAFSADVRSLSPVLGLLRGGGGGGGGGGHLFLTRVNGQNLFDCTMPTGPTLEIVKYQPSSAGGGGSAGGAIQLQAGRRLVLNGVVDASGGNGGGATTTNPAQPGGGAAGGAILMQAPQVAIQPVRGRIDVSGGTGGLGLVASGRARGGAGGPGMWRLESFLPIPDFELEKIKIEPEEGDLRTKYGAPVGHPVPDPDPNPVLSEHVHQRLEDIMTVAEWVPATEGPGAQSGVQSCWFTGADIMDPSDPDASVSNFFRLIFDEDDVVVGPGWDMTVKLTGFAVPVSYRGPNPLTMGTLQDDWGCELGMAPVIVRFQGAHATEALTQPCTVALTGIDSPITAGSLTPWVKHPMELTDFFGDPARAPNVFRWSVVWDASNPLFSLIESIEDISIGVTPD